VLPLTSSAPTRIDLAGGTIDIWPLYLFHDGASTVNAAISLRAHVEVASRADGRVELCSVDTGRTVGAARWSELDGGGELSLLALLARHYQLDNATLTTRGESPAGAGIAGRHHRSIHRLAGTRFAGVSDQNQIGDRADAIHAGLLQHPAGSAAARDLSASGRFYQIR
jgi:D-glycero-alpha-D-manno-heptose-7-phosphate kinase